MTSKLVSLEAPVKQRSRGTRSLAALLAAVTFLAPACGRPEPASETKEAVTVAAVVAAVAVAYEYAKKAKGFLEDVGLITKADPIAEIQARVAAIQATVEEIKATTQKTLELVTDTADHLVREANRNALNELLDALNLITDGQAAVSLMAGSPLDASLRAQADAATRKALSDFQNRPRIFLTYGPTIAEERFTPVNSYAGYLAAVGVRVAFIQLALGQPGFVKEPYRAELRKTAKHLRDLDARISAALSVQTLVNGALSGITCSSVTVSLADAIRYPKAEAVLMVNMAQTTIDIPDESCNQALINSIANEEDAALVAKRRGEYGSDLILAVAQTLEDYAAYGVPGKPLDYVYPSFGATVHGKLWSQDGFRSLVAPANAVPGSELSTGPEAAAQAWEVTISQGLVRHLASNLCVSETGYKAVAALEPCRGDASQVWQRLGQRFRNVATGYCLEMIFKPYSTTLPRFGRFLPVSSLCGTGPEFSWASTNSTPLPVVR